MEAAATALASQFPENTDGDQVTAALAQDGFDVQASVVAPFIHLAWSEYMVDQGAPNGTSFFDSQIQSECSQHVADGSMGRAQLIQLCRWNPTGPSCPSPRTPVSPAPTSAPVSSGLATPLTAPAHPSAAYTNARQQWVAGASAPYATDQESDWQQADTDLRAGASDAALRQDGVLPAVQDLDQLTGLPETDVTPQQQQEAQADISALDGFFNTPGLYD